MSFNGGIKVDRSFLPMSSLGNPTVRAWMYALYPNDLPAYLNASAQGLD